MSAEDRIMKRNVREVPPEGNRQHTGVCTTGRTGVWKVKEYRQASWPVHARPEGESIPPQRQRQCSSSTATPTEGDFLSLVFETARSEEMTSVGLPPA